MKMLLTGDPINAIFAKEIGLINDHYSADILESETLKLVWDKGIKRQILMILLFYFLIKKHIKFV